MKSLFVLFVLVFTCLNAQDIALAKSVKGVVKATIGSETLEVESGDWLNEKMIIMTKEKSEIKLIFKDDSILVLGENSILVLEKYTFKPEDKLYDFQLQLNKGIASFESGDIGKLSPDDFVFKTPESTIAIRGTKFVVKVQ